MNRCRINTDGDLWMDADAREFIGQSCIVLKQTKAGLIEVALASDKRKRYSFPKRNVVTDDATEGLAEISAAVFCGHADNRRLVNRK